MQSQISPADELLFRKMDERDKLEFSLCDSTDVKASILLLLITFLAGLTASLLTEKKLSTLIRFGHEIVTSLLAVSTVFAVLSLKPRDYSTEKRPDEYEGWLKKLREHYAGKPDAEFEVFHQFRSGSSAKTLARINENYKLNRSKLKYLCVSFWVLVAALGSELLLLSIQALTPLF